ncbi:WecB/TagA/CpsF family glycosyltransferase [Acuticoccus sp.]|uniref:WecB/TagA/CpsF family glycosyltransferase n=1 Tax=Acuticoccus sp. TaxID=1904378 RepID=UPI003B52B702
MQRLIAIVDDGTDALAAPHPLDRGSATEAMQPARPLERGGLSADVVDRPREVRRPRRAGVIGVPVSATTYAEAVDCILEAARRRRPYTVTALAVHGVVEASRDPGFRRVIEDFDMVTPDGQPVRFALNLLHRAGLRDRVYGPTLMLRLCERAARDGVGIYLYGSTLDTVTRLERELVAGFPGLVVAGSEPSIFRPLTAGESVALAQRIERSGAGLVFVGLGCPRQERFAHDHRDLIGVPQVTVGAAFDFHARTKKQAPGWVQAASLEWLYRLCQEPRRLFRRYLVTNSLFVWRFALQAIALGLKGRA